MDKKICIFDMDGTLIDSMGFWRRMERDYLTARGVAPGPLLEDIIMRLKPMTLTDAGRLFIDDLGFSGTPESIAAEMSAVMEDNYRLRVPLKPGIEAYLRALRARGVRLCTASATATPLVRLCLERLGIAGLFDFMISCVDVGASKDRPDVYFAAARRLDAAPRDIAVFEDSLKALTTAANAGFYTVAVYDEASDADWPALLKLADTSVKSWDEATRALLNS